MVYHEAVPYRLKVRQWNSYWFHVPLENVFPMFIGMGARTVRWFRLTFRWCGKRVNHWRRPRKNAR